MQRVKYLIAMGFLIGSWVASVPSGHAQQMVFPGAEWETATPESQRVDPDLLQSAVDYLDDRTSAGGGVRELVITRNGRVIWEGPESNNVHLTYSMAKSFASTALGLLVDDGLVTVDTLAKDYVPSMAADYPDVALRHLITHTSGYRAEEEGYPFPFSYVPEDPFTPGPPLFEAGSRFSYSPYTGIDQMMNVLTRAAGEPMQELFQRRIGNPIGLDPDSWDWDNYQTSDGLEVDGGGIGVNISAKDAARLGHLFLNQGKWNGVQLISSDWVERATNVQVSASIPEHPNSFVLDGAGIYGFGWWVNGIRSDGTRPYPGATPETFAALGAFENNIFVIPEWDMVITREGTGSPNTPPETWSSFFSLMGLAIGRPSGSIVLPPDPSYAIFDDDTDSIFDDQGDRSFDVLSSRRIDLGEFDLQTSNRMTRLVAKFRLPGGPDVGRFLESAQLRFFLERVEGAPAGPVSLYHSVTDNDEVGHASDYEDVSYQDTHLDLVQATDTARAYYTLDVTDLVLADYTSDEDDLVSAFRLQVDDAFFFEDNQTNSYRFTMPRANANQPQLVLTFIPEPSAITLNVLGLVCVLVVLKIHSDTGNLFTQ